VGSADLLKIGGLIGRRIVHLALIGREVDDKTVWGAEQRNGRTLEPVEPDSDVRLALEHCHRDDLLQLAVARLQVGPVQEGGRKVHVVDEQVYPGIARDLDRQAAVRADEGREVLRNQLVGGLTPAELDYQAVISRVRTNANVDDRGPG